MNDMAERAAGHQMTLGEGAGQVLEAERPEAGDRHHQICSENSSPAVVWDMAREGGKSRQKAKERC